MSTYASITELSDLVDAEVIVVTTLGELRTAIGYDRLGVVVLGIIEDQLEGAGLGYFPPTLLKPENREPRQHQELRVYRKGNGVGRVIDAVLKPSLSGDSRLRQSDGNDSETVQKIRALVCG